jgi:hypothetical protein
MIFRTLFFSAIVGITLGCDSGDLIQVRGTVTMDGEPLPHARVIYTLQGGSRPSFGMTDKSGYYELGYSTSRMGTPPGEYVVSISTFRAPDTDPSTGERIPGSKETVPVIYIRRSILSATVPDGIYDFDLDSDASEVVQPSMAGY